MGYVVVDGKIYHNTWTSNAIKLMQYVTTGSVYDNDFTLVDIEGKRVPMKPPYKITMFSIGKGYTYGDESYLPDKPDMNIHFLVQPYKILDGYPYNGYLKPIDKLEFKPDDNNSDFRRTCIVTCTILPNEIPIDKRIAITEIGLFAVSLSDSSQLPIMIAYVTLYKIRNPMQTFSFKWYLVW